MNFNFNSEAFNPNKKNLKFISHISYLVHKVKYSLCGTHSKQVYECKKLKIYEYCMLNSKVFE